MGRRVENVNVKFRQITHNFQKKMKSSNHSCRLLWSTISMKISMSIFKPNFQTSFKVSTQYQQIYTCRGSKPNSKQSLSQLKAFKKSLINGENASVIKY